MITTGCEGCCFLKKDKNGKGCVLGQFCATKDDQVYAPGYCRFCRSEKWASEQGTTDFRELNKRAIEERNLKFDLLVFFDEARHTIGDLERTLDSDWYVEYAKKIIIMDVTGFGKRKNLSLQYMNSKKHSIPIVVDSSTENESTDVAESTIRRVSKQVNSKFFMVIPAGSKLRNPKVFAAMIQRGPSRVIHWSFPLVFGGTLILPTLLKYGLFITEPYRILMQSVQVESFTAQLKKEEEETNMGLTWLCSEFWLV